MKRITKAATLFFMAVSGLNAQTSTCMDVVNYVPSKNVGSVGSFHLSLGQEEKAAQTYFYSGPGRVSKVRVYGSVPSSGGVPLRIHVYSVDMSRRPKQELAYADAVFWASDNAQGYISVNLPDGGLPVSDDFAVGVTVLNAWPWGNQFQLSYNGDGEGALEDLASVAGSSTGNNWTSAIDNFDKDGDFYLIPEMTHQLLPGINVASQCLSVGQELILTNQSAFSKDSMFNRITADNYPGTNYLYTWSFGDGSPVSHAENVVHSFSNAGSYNVSLTISVDGWAGTCTNTIQLPVSVGLNATVNSTVPVGCYGDKNGSLTALGSGGKDPYLYSLNGTNFQSLSTFGGLPSGAGVLTIKDALGCLKTTPYIIQEPPQLKFSSLTTTNSSCGASNGGILANAEGGTGPLMYKLNGYDFQSSGHFVDLSGGVYTVTVKDANGCQIIQDVIVNNYDSPVIKLLGKTNVSCNGLSDGSIQVSASGGTGVNQFSLDGGDTYQSTGVFNGLEADTYSILVRDAAGCSQGILVNVIEPMPIEFDVISLAAKCHDGDDAKLMVTNTTGGTGNFSYSLDGSTYQSSDVFSGLTAGEYQVYVKDVVGCSAVEDASIEVTPAISLDLNAISANCYGVSNGSVIATATGGSGGFLYSINGGSYLSQSYFSGLAAGQYVINAKDNRGCISHKSISINQPSQIQAVINSGSATCGINNGSILVQASGGFGSGYEYSLDGSTFNSTGIFNALNAGTYYITIRDGQSCKRILSKSVADADGPVIEGLSSTDVGCHNGQDGSITVSNVTGGTGTLMYSINAQNWFTNNQFTGLIAGNYNVFVKDVNGCIGTAETVLIQPDTFAISEIISHVTCHGENDGSVEVLASGGSGKLAYSIDNGNAYQASRFFSNLIAGEYEVTIRDIAGCTGKTNFTVEEPTLIEFTTGVLNVLCSGNKNGAISVNATGGVGEYQYSLDGSNFKSSNIFTGLNGGAYTVSVRDANGCVVSQVRTIDEPDSLEIQANLFDVSCAGGNNGAIDVSVVGGSGQNTYLWSNESITQDLSGLVAGTYELLVTDDNGCSDLESFVISQPESPIIINAVIEGTVSNKGSIDVTVTGGTLPYNFEWSNDSTFEDISDLTPGNYTITVTDASGCVSSAQFTVENTTGLNGFNPLQDDLVLYPNPTNDFIKVEWKNTYIEFVIITDIKGNILSKNKVEGASTIDVRQFAPGIYFIQVTSHSGTISDRFEVFK